MAATSPETMKVEIIRMATRVIHETYPDLPIRQGWPSDGSLREAILSGWNGGGDAYVGVYFDRGQRYFAVIVETRRLKDGDPEGWVARVCRTGRPGEGGAADVDEDILARGSIEDLTAAIAKSLSRWHQPFVIHMSEDCTHFEALLQSDIGTLEAEGISVSNVVATVMASSEVEALEAFREKGQRSRAFHEMVDRGIAHIAPPAGTPSP